MVIAASLLVRDKPRRIAIDDAEPARLLALHHEQHIGRSSAVRDGICSIVYAAIEQLQCLSGKNKRTRYSAPKPQRLAIEQAGAEGWMHVLYHQHFSLEF